MIIAITMWTVAIILGISDYETESTRWGMGLAFFAGIAGFSIFWGESVIPFAHARVGEPDETLRVIEVVLSALNHYAIPYFALMFGITYSGIISAKLQKTVSMLLFIPMFITYLLFPTHDYHILNSHRGLVYYRVFSVWAVPYLLLGSALLIYSYIKEKIPALKKQRLITCVIAVPGITITSITSYLLVGFSVNKPWQYNVIIVVYMFVLFLYNIIKDGAFNIKLRFEKQNLSNMMNVFNSGIKILNHSLKNEITKISICTTNIKMATASQALDVKEIQDNAQTVLESVEYLNTMVKKMQKVYTGERSLELSHNDLLEMIERALQSVSIFLKEKNIQVHKNLSCKATIFSDRLYLQDVFVHIFQNAIEAMDWNGKLSIETTLTKKGLKIVIQDNGTGISKEDLPHVIEPFFTTKDKRNNFGLGLSYCYNMLIKHGSTLDVQSEWQAGTTITLFFPKNKVCAV